MEYIGLDVHLYTATLHVLDRCGGDLKTVTIKGGWQKVVASLRQRRRVFSICNAMKPRPANPRRRFC